MRLKRYLGALLTLTTTAVLPSRRMRSASLRNESCGRESNDDSESPMAGVYQVATGKRAFLYDPVVTAHS